MNKVLAAALLAASCTLAHAEPSAAKKELIDKVLQTQRPVIEAQARAIIDRNAGTLMQQAAALVQQRVPVDKREALLRDIQGDVRQFIDETGPALRDQALKLHPSVTGAVLDAKFTEAELKQLLVALEAPAFRKYQQSSDEMFRPLNERLAQESRGVVESKLRVLDQSVRKRLEAAIGTGAPAAKP